MALAAAGCGGEKAASSHAPATIKLSSAFADGGAIPRADTCDGAGAVPALTWSGVPSGTRELVLTVYDPDASFLHWSIFGMSPMATTPPPGAASGRNSAGKDGWTPPCPPKGDKPHHYVFTLYALPKASGLKAGADLDAVNAAVKDALARGTLTGTFSRP